MATDDQAAPALLASTLLTTAETHEKSRPPPASSGLVSLDELALDGGFRYGEITSIAAAGDIGKTAVSFAFASDNKGFLFLFMLPVGLFLLHVRNVFY